MSLSYPPLMDSKQKTYDDFPIPDPSRTDIFEITTDNEQNQPSKPEPSVSKLPSVFSHLSTFFEAKHRKSMFRQVRTLSQAGRIKLILLLILMIICGVGNDFLPRFNFQSLNLPPLGNGTMESDYQILWFIWLLTTTCDVISFFTIVYGWEHGEQWNKVNNEWKPFWFYIFISGTLTFLHGSCLFLSFVYLSASVVSLLKIGTQMLFSALFRKWSKEKSMSILQAIGFFIVTVGLVMVGLASAFGNTGHGNLKKEGPNNAIGITAVLISSFCASVRNHYEQILCSDMKFNAYFVIGMREIPTFFWLLVNAICLYFAQKFQKSSIDFFQFAFDKDAFTIGFVLLIVSVFLKNLTQMKVIELSSSLTRNVALQLVPFGVWGMSLVFHAENKQYGEGLNNWSFMELGGFFCVLIGSYCYMKLPSPQYIAAVSIQADMLLETTKTNEELDAEMICTTGDVTSLLPLPEL